MAINQITLWSWLIKSETKEEFRCPPGLRVTNQEFTTELARQIQANQLPAQVELCEVNWDDTNTKQTRAVVRYTGSDARTDVVRLLVGVDQLGNFAYVERKSYLRPPQLPKTPRERKETAISSAIGCAGGIGIIVSGIFLILLGLLAVSVQGSTWPIFLCFAPGILAVIFAIWMLISEDKEKNEAQAWNAAASEEQAAWDKTWDSWQREVLRAAYLSKTDDVFGRFTSAVSSCVDDVVKVLFVDRNAELRNKTERAQTQEAIEKELQRRRSEAFS